MKITTKYNVGDKLYFLHDNKIVSYDALSIQTFHSSVYPEGIIKYAFGNNKIDDKEEKECFLSKAELIEALA